MPTALDSHRRGEYILSAAKAFASVTPDFFWSAPDAVLEEWLRGIRGIGPWSARFILLRALDVTKVCRRMTYGAGMTLTPQDVERIASEYGRWRGVLRPLPAGVGVKQGDTDEFVNSQPSKGGDHLHGR